MTADTHHRETGGSTPTEHLTAADEVATTAPATLRFGYRAALLTSALTVISFALALTALPDHVPYPFTADVIAEQWPGDYLWMYPAMVLMLVVVALVAAIHESAPPARRVFSLLALCITVISAAVLLVDYFLQATVMQIGLEKGQLDGWSMLTMYNPNGVFIALEELGYVLLSSALLCLAAVFVGKTGVERAIRWLFVTSFAAVLVALALVSAFKGIDRGYTFEIAVISVVWLTLIAAGPLVATVFRRAAARCERPRAR